MEKDNTIFYHDGATEDFSVDEIDIYKIGEKQNHKNRTNAGFYMFGEERRDKAFHYAEQINTKLGLKNRGVIKLFLNNDLKIYVLDGMATIDRISIEMLKEYVDMGYDLLSGKSYDGVQYVLLNKDKIKSIEFESMEMRYNENKNDIVSLKKNVYTNEEIAENISKNTQTFETKDIRIKGKEKI